ncbi:MAG: MarR family transcriptional regulator [Terricaulis sp.]|nr:MarR family transcriptional regulator [Terricaulis sp.]
MRQFAVLAAVAQRPGLSQSELTSETGIDRSTLAEMLARMQKRGWITRAAHALDQRAQTVRLTEAGELMLRNSAVPRAPPTPPSSTPCPAPNANPS